MGQLTRAGHVFTDPHGLTVKALPSGGSDPHVSDPHVSDRFGRSAWGAHNIRPF